MNGRAELLAPAGSFETMKAAYHAGADAVYLGGRVFGARAYAGNLDDSQLLEAIRYAHLHGRKLYLTVNTLLKEEELEEQLFSYLRPCYEEGLDAVIVQDMGVLRRIREWFPGLPIHASTQMTITGECAAQKLEELGVKRLVVPRELSLKEIRKIRGSGKLEIEAFVHGALCYCYSGQCLFSSLAGGRSGNRGRCAQPCRLEYCLMRGEEVLVPEKNGYLLSPKDLSTIYILPKLLQVGVDSLKIEGRMKKAEYTAGVVSIYRKYLDTCLERGGEGYHVLPKDEQILFDLFNRKGFTDGYYFRHNGRQMLTMTKPEFRPENKSLVRDVRESFIDMDLKESLKGKIKIRTGEAAIIELSCRDILWRQTGDVVERAKNRPMSHEDILRPMEKIRDTEFCWEELEIDTDSRSFYPVKKLNELRRDALRGLEETMYAAKKRKLPEKPRRTFSASVSEACREEGDISLKWYACAETEEQLTCLLSRPWLTRVYLDSHIAPASGWKSLAGRVKSSGKECYFTLPRMIREETENRLRGQLAQLQGAGFDGYLTSTAEGLCFLHRYLKPVRVVGDHTLYAWTRAAEEEWKDWGAFSLTLPVELNREELAKRGAKGMEAIVYGRLPMMITAQCLHRSSVGCIHCGEDLCLRDRKGNMFPVRNYCGECYNIIYNSKPLLLADAIEPLKKMSLEAARLLFTTEDRAETEAVLDLFEKAAYGQKLSLGAQEMAGYTRGHFRRGVE